MSFKYNKYIVAHLDFLGSRNTLENNKSAEVFLNNLKDIYLAIPNEIEKLNESVKNEFNLQKDGFNCSDFNIKTKIFSDNICIYLKYPNLDIPIYRVYIAWFLQMIALFQYYAISKHEMLVRGAVDIGNFYEDDIFIIGKALSESYEAETNCAFAPRILICENLKKDFFNKEKSEAIPFTRKDFDKNLFVDYLIYTNQKNKSQKELLEHHRSILIKKFEEAIKYEHKLKILLAMIYHNRFCTNSNEWDFKYKTGEYNADVHETKECAIDITKFLVKNSI